MGGWRVPAGKVDPGRCAQWEFEGIVGGCVQTLEGNGTIGVGGGYMGYRDKIPKNLEEVETAVVDLTPEELAEVFTDLASLKAVRVLTVPPARRGRKKK